MQAKIHLSIRQLSVILLLVGFAGCGPKAVDAPVAKKEHADAVVRVWCGDPKLSEVFGPRAKAWAYRNSAKVEMVSSESDADVLLVPPSRLGQLDPLSTLRQVPASLTSEGGNYQWGGLLAVYQTQLAHWGGERYAVPLMGEGSVLVYRADLLTDAAFADAFRKKYSRPPVPIRTWDDLAEVGRFATERSGKPALAPLPSDPAAAVAAFGHIAACYDRLAATGGQREGKSDPYLRGLSFFTDAQSLRDRSPKWEVRIAAPAFAEAFDWYGKTASCRPAKPGDSIDALVGGSAVAAVVPIGDLARLPVDASTGAVEGRFSVGPVPGSDAYFDGDGQRQKTNGVNRVPHYPGRGLAGVVKQSAAHPEAAWALLGELGGPVGSAATLDSPSLGGGPLRVEHATDATRHWQHYGFDKARTTDLTKAVRDYVAAGTINPAVGLRTPDAGAINALLARHLVAAASGEVAGPTAHQQAVKAWEELDAKTPREVRLAQRRKAVGME